MAAPERVELRRSRIYGGSEWVWLGAVSSASTPCVGISKAYGSPSAPISSACEPFAARLLLGLPDVNLRRARFHMP
jgi:hypothetical protein